MTRQHRSGNRAVRLAQRVGNRLSMLAIRGQLGPLRETELARLSGARR